MSEYWVSHKRMNNSETRIIKVKAMKVLNDKLGRSKEFRRAEVVESIERDNDWFTCAKTGDNEYKRKAEIHVLKIDNEKFIRTDRNEIKEDNLGELPDF